MSKKGLYVAVTFLLLGGMVLAMIYKNKKGVDLENIGNSSYGVSTDHPEAARIGMKILEKGGSAVDAAIAVSYALGVAEPFGSGVGGSGLMLVHPNQSEKNPTVFNYRETAPMGRSPRNVGVPGFIRGMELAHQQYGKLPMKELIQPSIGLCKKGVEARDVLTRRLTAASYRLQPNKMPHLFPSGRPIQPGEKFVQPQLATTLEKISKEGSNAFYTGTIARDIEIASQGVTPRDLNAYKAKQVNPISAKIGEYEMLTVPPPGGGVLLMQFLLMAQQMHLEKMDHKSAEWIKTMGALEAQIVKIRRKYVGDPDFVNVPIEKITSKRYLARYIKRIQKGTVISKDRDEYLGKEKEDEDDNTTHFVIVDKNGMMVSCTNTLGNFFGSGIMVDGFFLNDGLAKFNTSRRAANCYQPGKRPLTFTAPTIFTKEDKPVLGIGASGGPRVPFILAEVIIPYMAGHKSLQQVISEPRFYVKENVANLEKNYPSSVRSGVQANGYLLDLKPAGVFFGGVQAIRVDPKTHLLEGGYDFRREATFKGSE